MNEASGLLVDDVAHHAGSRDGDVDAHLGLAAAVQRAGHEGVVLGHVAEDDELGAADAVVGRRQLAQREQHVGHAHHGVHVDAGARARRR